MFYPLDQDKHTALMAAFDGMNEKYGRSTIKLAAEGTKREWRLNRQRLSPLYTTNINDIIVAE